MSMPKSNSIFYTEPILIPYHPHPLIHCLHDKGYTCNSYINLINNNEIEKNDTNHRGTGCSFFCTFCNYDICEECFENIELYKIIFYAQNLIKKGPELKMTEDFSYLDWKKFKCHEHPMPEIIKNYIPFNWICSECKKNYITAKDEKNANELNYEVVGKFYICSLCSYILCQTCAVKNEE